MKTHLTNETVRTESPMTPAAANDATAEQQPRKRAAGRIYQAALSDHMLRDLGINRFGFREVA